MTREKRILATLVAFGLLLALCAPLPLVRSARTAEEPLGDRRRCARYSGLPVGFAQDQTAGMVWIEGGVIALGSQHGYPEERGGPAVHVPGFWIDRTEVTNAQFARFVEATGYVTQAEQEGAAPVFHAPSERELTERGDYA